MKVPSFYFPFLCFLFNSSSTSSTAKLPNGNRRSHCGEKFKWNEGLENENLLDDCMLLQDSLILKDSVLQITDKTECIDSAHLMIEGIHMETNWTATGHPLTSREIIFSNELLQELRKIPVRATFTARNFVKINEDFVLQFHLDPKHCSKEDGDRAVDDVDESQNGRRDAMLSIIAGVVSIILIVTVVALVVWKRKRGNGAKDANNFHTDENHTYGTYSRGWEEGGEYGDGDKVYVTDSNDYYAKEV